jgi:starch phosphorylase
MPTYSGGLGVLAGDTIRSAADLGVPMVAVTLLYRKGYFYQKLDGEGRQTEEPVHWTIEDYLEELPERAMVRIEGRPVSIRPWRYWVEGVTGTGQEDHRLSLRRRPAVQALPGGCPRLRGGENSRCPGI